MLDVTTLQTNLARRGFDPGAIDGQFGARTLLACCEVVAGRGCVSLETAQIMAASMLAKGINTPLRIINFLANCGAETKFRLVAENLNYSAARLVQVWPSRFPNAVMAAQYAGNPEKLGNVVYANRMGNGPPQSGDGYRYRGRGWCQLTGRDAYATVGKLVGLDLVTNPDQLLQPGPCAAASAGFYVWKGIGLLADLDDAKAVRQKWNGGLNGWPDVLAAVTSLKGLWGLA